MPIHPDGGPCGRPYGLAMTSGPSFRTLVAGGGPAALEAVLVLRDLAPSMHVELVAPEPTFVYRPMSVATPFAHGEPPAYDLDHLEDLGVHVRHDALLRADVETSTVRTASGAEVPYDALLVATGAHARREIPRVLTFEGPAYTEAMAGLVRDIEGGHVRSVAFVAPPGATWTLPLYELALQTAERADASCLDGVHLSITSYEQRPVEALGSAASDVLERLLGEAGIAFACGQTPPGADRIVALPAVSGPNLPGLPADEHGFLPVDSHGRVQGAPRVWAAGDATDHEPKQGGLATQQAAVAARSIAAAAGLAPVPAPYAPVLRAKLLTGRGAWYFTRELSGAGRGEASPNPLWHPATKIAGERLGPYLHHHAVVAEAAR